MDLVALGAVVYALINFLKYLRNKDWNGTYTQLTVWVSGILIVLLAAEAEIAASIDVFGVGLGQMDFASKMLVGLSTASLFSFGTDLKKAVDGSDSAVKPDLF